MGEDEDFAPAQIFDVAHQRGMSLELSGDITQVSVLLVGGEDWIETLRPQIMVSNLMSPRSEFLEHDVAKVRYE